MDLFGPDGVVRAAAARPSEPNFPLAPDTWFDNCVNGAPGTGTPVGAHWLNRVTGALRGLVRKNAIGEVNGDDNILVKAVRSQRTNYVAAVGGTANAPVITLDPAPSDWADLIGVPLRLRLASTPTNAMTLGVTGLAGTRTIIKPSGAPMRFGDVVSGQILTLVYDGTNMQAIGLRAFGGAPRAGQAILTTQNFTVPADTYFVDWELVGAGGGGGGGGNATAAGRGGGGGGYCRGIADVTPGQVIACTIGTGGAGGLNTGTNGANGGATSFGSFGTGNGGTGGGGTGSGVATTGGTGGGATGGFYQVQGGAGAPGLLINTVYSGGQGGGSLLGGLGYALAVGTVGGGSPWRGGGATGASGANAGGQGSDGLIILRW